MIVMGPRAVGAQLIFANDFAPSISRVGLSDAVPKTFLFESVKVTVPAGELSPYASATVATNPAEIFGDRTGAAASVIVLHTVEPPPVMLTEARIPPLSFDAFKERFATPEFCGVHECDPAPLASTEIDEVNP